MYTLNETANPIDEKIELLQDLCVLRKGAVKQEEAVRKILATCQSDRQLDIKVHDLVCGNETIKQFIGRHKQ